MTLDDLLIQGREDQPITCPFHVVRNYKGEVSQETFASCWVNLKKHVFHCFGCGVGGPLARLKAQVEGIPYKEAYFKLYGTDLPPYVNFEDETVREDPTYDNSYLAPFSPAGDIPERGITKESSEKYQILRSDGGLVLPYRDMFGSLRGLQIRYANPLDTENWYDQLLWFRRSSFLFGEQLLRSTDTRIVVLTEGAFDAVKLHSVLGDRALFMAINGSLISPSQLFKLAKFDIGMIVWWTDNDSTGRQNLPRNYKNLKKLCSGEVWLPGYVYSDPKDACETTPERIEEQWNNMKWVGGL